MREILLQLSEILSKLYERDSIKVVWDSIKVMWDSIKVYEILSKLSEILSKLCEILSKLCEILSKLSEILSKLYKILSKLCEILSKLCERDVIKVYEILYGAGIFNQSEVHSLNPANKETCHIFKILFGVFIGQTVFRSNTTFGIFNSPCIQVVLKTTRSGWAEPKNLIML